MKAHELRIGNWIQVSAEWNDNKKHLEDVEVRGIQDDGELWTTATGINGSSVFECKDSEPIELTKETVKEWLVDKFGFENLYENYYYFYKEDIEFAYYYTCSGSSWTFELNGNSIDIKHVHQVQNLFFAIRGKEIDLM